MTTLGTIGERRLISEFLVPRYAREGPSFGDDCAVFPPVPAGSFLVGTTDPCPEPAAALIGMASPEAFGR